MIVLYGGTAVALFCLDNHILVRPCEQSLDHQDCTATQLARVARASPLWASSDKWESDDTIVTPVNQYSTKTTGTN
jgi:hypothetical protein